MQKHTFKVNFFSHSENSEDTSSKEKTKKKKQKTTHNSSISRDSASSSGVHTVVSHVVFYVDDLKVTVDFWSKALGCTVLSHSESVAVIDVGNNVHIMFMSKKYNSFMFPQVSV